MEEAGEGVECYITRGVSKVDRKHAKKDPSSLEGKGRTYQVLDNIDLE